MALIGTVTRAAYSVEDAAAALSISRRSAYRRIAAHEIRTVKLGGRRLVPAAELERLLAGAQANVDLVAPPQTQSRAVRTDAPVELISAAPIERPRLSDLLAQTGEVFPAR